MNGLCKKCGYQRLACDLAPDYECPKCGAVYAKVEAHLEREKLKKQNNKAEKTEDGNQQEEKQDMTDRSENYDPPNAANESVSVYPQPQTSSTTKPISTKINVNDKFMPTEPKQFWIALVLKLLLPGAGHLYAGQNQSGTTLIIINIISWALVVTGIGGIGVVGSWLYALVTTDKIIKEFNVKVGKSNEIIEQQAKEEQQRLKNVVSSQAVAESFMKADKLRSLDIITEPEFVARKAAIIGELRFKIIDGDPDDILLALAPMKQAGAVSADEVMALKNILASF
jgi:hypothetical protein